MKNAVTIKKVWEGRCGMTLVPYFETYVDGNLVGGGSRKWLAIEIGNAVAAGSIGSDGDTEMALIKWARDNNPALFSRLMKLS